MLLRLVRVLHRLLLDPGGVECSPFEAVLLSFLFVFVVVFSLSGQNISPQTFQNSGKMHGKVVCRPARSLLAECMGLCGLQPGACCFARPDSCSFTTNPCAWNDCPCSPLGSGGSALVPTPSMSGSQLRQRSLSKKAAEDKVGERRALFSYLISLFLVLYA